MSNNQQNSVSPMSNPGGSGGNALSAGQSKKPFVLSPLAKEFVPSNFQYRNPGATKSNDNGDTGGDGVDSIILQVKKFISNVIYNPGNYEVFVDGLTEELGSSHLEEEAFKQILNLVYTEGILQQNFMYSAARLCAHFSSTSLFPQGLFLKLLLIRCSEEYNKREELMSTKLSYFRSYVLLLAELYSQLESIPDINKDQIRILGKYLHEIAFTLLKNPITENCRCVMQIMKLSGSRLEDLNKIMEVKPNLDEILVRIKEILAIEGLERSPRNMLTKVVELRSTDWERNVSNAPAIPNPYENFNPAEPVFFGPDGHVLTQEEAFFLDSLQCEFDNLDGPSFNSFEEYEQYMSDEMDEEAHEAYEQFLRDTQQKK